MRAQPNLTGVQAAAIKQVTLLLTRSLLKLRCKDNVIHSRENILVGDKILLGRVHTFAHLAIETAAATTG